MELRKEEKQEGNIDFGTTSVDTSRWWSEVSHGVRAGVVPEDTLSCPLRRFNDVKLVRDGYQQRSHHFGSQKVRKQ